MAALLALAGCGGGGSDAPPPTAAAPATAPTGGTGTSKILTTRPSQTDAARLLTQATYGPSEADINHATAMTYGAWLEEQFAMPNTYRHKERMEIVMGTARRFPNPYSSTWNLLKSSFWKRAITGEDQLRQRMVLALSELFVISANDADVGNHPRGLAHFYDMLGNDAFGNYRQLLEDVTMHPMMGLYLSHLANQKETDTVVPDENFARKVMQLFSIGVYQLNPDGTTKLVNGKPVEAYTNDDIMGLARVFTGFS